MSQEQTPASAPAESKMRLAMAARIAAGMSANPRVYECQNWRGQVARDSWELAGMLLLLEKTGGC
jgi:hypothetical protein